MARLGEVGSVLQHRSSQALEKVTLLREADGPRVLAAVALPVPRDGFLGREPEVLAGDARRRAGDRRCLLAGPTGGLRPDVRNGIEAPAAADERPDSDARPLLAVERL